MLKVGFHNPDFPDDVIFDLGGIPVPNNGSVELSYDDELRFFATHRSKVKDRLKDNEYVTIEGSTELSKSDYGNYPGDDQEVSTETIVDLDEGDPTIPDVDPETGEVVEGSDES